ncbi:BrnT family toxin [Pigmentiphaga soli]
MCYGLLCGRMVVIGYTQRDRERRVFSMRKANEREQERIGPYLEI